MGAFSDLIGQGYAVKFLLNQIANNRVAHCYVFSGPRGVGKYTAAKAFAQGLNCSNRALDHNACGLCTSCKLIERGVSPDVMTVNKDWQDQTLAALGKEKKKSDFYLIEPIRELMRGLSLSVSSGRTRVVIIDRAELLTGDASSALLKTLEEPPSRTIFILIVQEPGALQPTILSRSQTVRFSPLGKDAFLAVARRYKSEVSEDEFYAYNASPGLFCESLALASREEQGGEDLLGAQPDMYGVFSRLDAHAKNRDTVDTMLLRVLEALRSVRTPDEKRLKALEAVLGAHKRQDHFANTQLNVLYTYMKFQE